MGIEDPGGTTVRLIRKIYTRKVIDNVQARTIMQPAQEKEHLELNHTAAPIGRKGETSTAFFCKESQHEDYCWGSRRDARIKQLPAEQPTASTFGIALQSRPPFAFALPSGESLLTQPPQDSRSSCTLTHSNTLRPRAPTTGQLLWPTGQMRERAW